MKRGARHCWVIYREKICHTVLETCAFLKAILGSLAAFCRYLKGSKHCFRFSEECHGKQFSALLVTLSRQRNALKTTSAHAESTDLTFIDLQKVSISWAIFLYQTQNIYACISGTPLLAQETHVRLEKLTYAVNRCMKRVFTYASWESSEAKVKRNTCWWEG